MWTHTLTRAGLVTTAVVTGLTLGQLTGQALQDAGTVPVAHEGATVSTSRPDLRCVLFVNHGDPEFSRVICADADAPRVFEDDADVCAWTETADGFAADLRRTEAHTLVPEDMSTSDLSFCSEV